MQFNEKEEEAHEVFISKLNEIKKENREMIWIWRKLKRASEFIYFFRKTTESYLSEIESLTI